MLFFGLGELDRELADYLKEFFVLFLELDDFRP
jgi:hypothetical protein